MSVATVSGIDIAPTKRSAIAMLDNSIVDVFFSSLLWFTAKISSAFKKVVARDAVSVMGKRNQGIVVSFKSHVKFDDRWQRITDLTLLMGGVLVSVLFTAMLIWNSEHNVGDV